MLAPLSPVPASVEVGLIGDVEERHDQRGADDPLSGVEGGERHGLASR
jgi:hypothetical protein